MRILHLLASPVWSGPAENVALLAVAQRALGHDVTIAIDRKREGLKDEEPLKPRLQKLSLLDERGLELSVKSSPLAWLRDVRLLKKQPLDVVHSHFSHDHFIARFGRPKSTLLVRSVHAPRSLKGLLKADAYTSTSQKDALPPAPKRTLQALLSPEFKPSADKEALRKELNLKGAPLIGMVSHFQPSRRHDLGLRAFAELRRIVPAARLVLIGDGPLRAELEAQARSLSVDVTFAGYQRGDQFLRHLQALDAVWLLGLGNDFTARAARQARACDVRVLGVDEGALPQWCDVTVPLTAEAIAIATTALKRRAVKEPTNDELARDVIALYEEARVSHP